ncbi:MAG: Holliday junction branch migration protein RuvA [Chitinophagaceae bacterium]|nr:Holliday junction branch migration protein RuvA [Chitinophagaceae bacterium]MBL0054604.1 Holliday junction branch migration protein RuvA [Chitinophagaceae bacterium]
MYAYLQGKFSFKSPAQVIIDVNGVGYEVNISLNTYSALQNLEEGRLFTHLQVKEDGHVLFGFFEKTEKEMFQLLIGVSGVGAATARMMLSSLRPEEVTRAIQQGNVAVLERVKGIGKKTAERLVLELKDKAGKLSGSDQSRPQGNSLEQDALNALIALGISRSQAEQSIQKIILAEPSVSHLEELIKKALKAI